MKTHRYILAIGPAFLLAVICLLIPLVVTILPSFFSPSFSISAYTDFFRAIFFRSIRLSVITTLICMAIGLPTSYYISLRREKTRRILLSLIMFPLLTNAVARGFAWISILGRNGLINQFSLTLGIIKDPMRLLYTDFAIVIGSVYLFLPVMISTLTSVMEGIGDDVIEAAYGLGCSPTHTFFKVIIPLSFSGLLVASVLVFSGTISAYTTPTLLGGNQNMMLASLLYQQSNILSNWSTSAVIAFIMILISLGVMKLFNIMAAKVDKREVRQVVPMVTSVAAKVLGMKNRLGSLEVGKDADILVLGLEMPNAIPCFDPYSVLVYSMGVQNVRHLFTRGEWVVKDHQLTKCDIRVLRRDFLKAAQPFLKEAKKRL